MKASDLLGVCALFLSGVPSAGTDGVSVSVMEGDPVTLNTDVTVTQQQRIKWYFNDTRIAQITGDLSFICTDVQCNEGVERFRDRLNLDNQTGLLTITNARTTDSGLYRLQIISNTISEKIFNITVIGMSGADRVFVMEGDSVTLYTDVKTNQNDRIKWFHNDTRIAQKIGGQSDLCTDAECPKKFRDRLKLDNQTGSLTITNINITDAGQYKLHIVSSSSSSEKIFSVAVHGVSASERGEMKAKSVKEGESVTLDPDVGRKANDVMTWYFNVILIAEMNGHQSKICTDEQCDERFKDRLKVDHQTGSLTIMNTRTEDSGVYKLEITSSRFSIRRRRHTISITSVKSFNVSVTDSSLSAGAVTGIVIAVLIVVAAVGGAIYHCKKNYTPVDTQDDNL